MCTPAAQDSLAVRGRPSPAWPCSEKGKPVGGWPRLWGGKGVLLGEQGPDPETFRRRPHQGGLARAGLCSARPRPARARAPIGGAAWPGTVHPLLREWSPTHTALLFLHPGCGWHTPLAPGLAPETLMQPLDRGAWQDLGTAGAQVPVPSLPGRVTCKQVHLTFLNWVSNVVANINDTKKKNHPESWQS